MIRPLRSIAPLLALTFGLLVVLVAYVQSAIAAPEPTTMVVSIYRVAPGKHLDFLKWMAAREAVAREAGIADTQWYVHMDGDSWDYIAIAPETTDAQDDKVDKIQMSKGMTTGFKGGLELRTMMASHTDTYARGPTTASALVDAASK